MSEQGLGDSVELWRIGLDQTPAVVDSLWRLLSADEQERAASFRFDRHRRRFVVGRGALRQILGAHLAMAPEQVRFVYGEKGKPALAPAMGSGALSFNLSNSADQALCVVAEGRQVGIDLEVLRVIEEGADIARRFFTPAEIALIADQSRGDSSRLFLQCWTLKEAWLKGVGSGLSAPLHTIDLSPLLTGQSKALRVQEGLVTWQVMALSLPEGDGVAGLALTGDSFPRLIWRDWEG